MRDLARELVKKHEGLRLKPYECTAGKLSIGYGRNLDDNGISQAEADTMLENDLDAVYARLDRLDWFANISAVRQAVLADMCFNLGWPRLSGFRKMLAAVSRGDYDRAAEEMLDSRWRHQVGERALYLARVMRDNKL